MTQPVIFISYSHKDEEWKDRLVTHLGVLEHQGLLDAWDDRRIEGGEAWHQEIEEAMSAASVGVLLVSANFLTSKFILGEEVPRLLRRRDEEGIRIFPIIIRPCAWKRVGWLAHMQVRPKDGRSLSAGTEHQIDADLAAIANEIADIVDRATQAVAPPDHVSPGPSEIPTTRPPTFASVPPPASGGGTSVHIGGDVSGQVAIGSDIQQVGAVHTTAPSAPARTACPACGADVKPDARFCPSCGGSLIAAPTPAAEPKPDALTITFPIHLELVRVPAGEFLMGSDRGKDEYALRDEQPQHGVYVPEFYIGRYPVTNAQYAAFVGAAKHRLPEHWKNGKIPRGKENHPVTYVSWHDAVAFCEWLSRESGRSFRLPTEAEWEKAARGIDGRIYPWGDEPPTHQLCNLGTRADTTPVGQYSPRGDSPYGCADMVGNVCEWTQSLYLAYPYDPADGREELEVGEFIEDWRVTRGGLWWDPGTMAQGIAHSSYRTPHSPDDSSPYIGTGFRCASPVADSES